MVKRSMSLLVVVLFLILPTLAEEFRIRENRQLHNLTLTPDQIVRVDGNHNTVTASGSGKAVRVSGNHNRISIRASVEEVIISGNHNVLNIESAVDAVRISGSYNTYQLSVPPGGQAPAFVDTGTYNKAVTRGSTD